MRLARISTGNLWRRKERALLLITGLATGVALVIALTGVTFALKSDLERKLDEYGANIIVTPRSEHLALRYGGVDVADASYRLETLEDRDAAAIATIRNSRNISTVAPKVMGVKTIGGREILVVGVRFPAEYRIKKWWRLQGAGNIHSLHSPMPDIDPANEVLLGSTAARALKSGPGGMITLNNRTYRVKGVLEENASQDDTALFMDLGEAQRLLGKTGRLSLIEVSALCAQCPIEDIVAQISERLPHAKVSAVRQAMTLRMETVNQVVRYAAALSIAVLVVGALIVFVSMTASVNERTREIGVLRAIGYRKRHIVSIILVEAAAVSLAAGLAGWLAGSAAVCLVAAQLTEAGVPFFQPANLFGALGLAAAVGMGSSIQPALRAARLDPFEAIRAL